MGVVEDWERFARWKGCGESFARCVGGSAVEEAILGTDRERHFVALYSGCDWRMIGGCGVGGGVDGDDGLKSRRLQMLSILG